MVSQAPPGRSATGPGGTDALTRTGYITVTGGEEYTVTARTITYTYDPLNRLTKAEYSTGESFAYQYDAVGNATVVIELLTTTVTTTYTLRQAQGGPTTPPTN